MVVRRGGGDGGVKVFPALAADARHGDIEPRAHEGGKGARLPADARVEPRNGDGALVLRERQLPPVVRLLPGQREDLCVHVYNGCVHVEELRSSCKRVKGARSTVESIEGATGAHVTVVTAHSHLIASVVGEVETLRQRAARGEAPSGKGVLVDPYTAQRHRRRRTLPKLGGVHLLDARHEDAAHGKGPGVV